MYDDGKMVSGDDATGRDLWRTALNAAVVLTENHRAKGDPAYAELLRVLRVGSKDKRVWRAVICALRSLQVGSSGDDVLPTNKRKRERINQAWNLLAKRAASRQHAVGADDLSDTSGAMQSKDSVSTSPTSPSMHIHAAAAKTGVPSTQPSASPSTPDGTSAASTTPLCTTNERIVIVPRNRDRIKINAAFGRRCIDAVNAVADPDATWRARGVLLIDAIFHRFRPYERNPPPYADQWQTAWRRLVSEVDLGNKYAPILRLIFGKRYMITQNINISHGVANGMWAVVRDVRLRDGAEPRWDVSEGAYRVGADEVECLIIEYPDKAWNDKKLLDKLPAGHFVLTPDTPQAAAAGFKQFTYNLCGNIKKFRVTQLPLIQAHAVTGHKSQGQSLPFIVLAALHGTGSDGRLIWLLRELGWFYTGASRTKTRDGLRIRSDKLPIEHMQHERSQLLKEMRRLEQLHKHTMRLVQPVT